MPRLTSRQKAFLHGPDQGVSPKWEPPSALSPCPLLPSALGPSFCSALLWCPAVSGMPQTENLLPRTAPCGPEWLAGSVASHSQTPTPGRVESEWLSSRVHPPRAPELWWDAGFLPLPLFPHAHCPAGPHAHTIIKQKGEAGERAQWL